MKDVRAGKLDSQSIKAGKIHIDEETRKILVEEFGNMLEVYDEIRKRMERKRK